MLRKQTNRDGIVTIESERFGGIIVRWPRGLMLLVDATGAWVAFGKRILGRVEVFAA